MTKSILKIGDGLNLKSCFYLQNKILVSAQIEGCSEQGRYALEFRAIDQCTNKKSGERVDALAANTTKGLWRSPCCEVGTYKWEIEWWVINGDFGRIPKQCQLSPVGDKPRSN